MPYIKVVLAGALLALAVAAPATAHEGNPNYSSEVSAIAPALPGLEARVLNHDDRIELVWTGAGTLVVEGYRGEPYLRFGPDGRVEVNRRSPAAYLNEDRFAQVEVPGRADHRRRSPSGRPSTADGRYDWHDHRIHWMGEGTLPPQVEDEGRAHEGLRLAPADGRRRDARAVRGTLTWLGDDERRLPAGGGDLALAAARRGRRAWCCSSGAGGRARRREPGEGRGLVRARRCVAPRRSLLLGARAPARRGAHAELVADHAGARRAARGRRPSA